VFVLIDEVESLTAARKVGNGAGGTCQHNTLVLAVVEQPSVPPQACC